MILYFTNIYLFKTTSDLLSIHSSVVMYVNNVILTNLHLKQ